MSILALLRSHHIARRHISAHRLIRTCLVHTMMLPQQSGPQAAHRLLDFVNASPTPFHAIRVASAKLEKAGFRKVAGHTFSPIR